MGAVAESMLTGEACEMCGIWLPGKAPGHPRYCSEECAEDRSAPMELVVEEEEWEDL